MKICAKPSEVLREPPLPEPDHDKFNSAGGGNNILLPLIYVDLGPDIRKVELLGHMFHLAEEGVL